MNSEFSSPLPFPNLFTTILSFCNERRKKKKRQNIISFSMRISQSALASVTEPPTLLVDSVLMKKRTFNKTGIWLYSEALITFWEPWNENKISYSWSWPWKNLAQTNNKCFTQTWVTHFLTENLKTLIESEDRGLGLKLLVLIRIMTCPLYQAITSLQLQISSNTRVGIHNYQATDLLQTANTSPSGKVSFHKSQAQQGHSKSVCSTKGWAQLGGQRQRADVTTACFLLPKLLHLREPTPEQCFCTKEGRRTYNEKHHRIWCPTTKLERTLTGREVHQEGSSKHNWLHLLA